MAEIVFFLSVGVAHAMTNIDNLAVMLILVPAIGLKRCMIAYFCTQLVCIGISGIAGTTAISLLGAWVGYLGCIPIGLGLFAFWQQTQGNDVIPIPPPGSMAATVVLFFGLGLDTIVIMSAVFGDSSELWRGLAYLGAAASLSTLTAVFLLIVNGHIAGGIVKRMSRFAPYTMIAVGIYILSDSFSDAV